MNTIWYLMFSIVPLMLLLMSLILLIGSLRVLWRGLRVPSHLKRQRGAVCGRCGHAADLSLNGCSECGTPYVIGGALTPLARIRNAESTFSVAVAWTVLMLLLLGLSLSISSLLFSQGNNGMGARQFNYSWTLQPDMAGNWSATSPYEIPLNADVITRPDGTAYSADFTARFEPANGPRSSLMWDETGSWNYRGPNEDTSGQGFDEAQVIGFFEDMGQDPADPKTSKQINDLLAILHLTLDDPGSLDSYGIDRQLHPERFGGTTMAMSTNQISDGTDASGIWFAGSRSSGWNGDTRTFDFKYQGIDPDNAAPVSQQPNDFGFAMGMNSQEPMLLEAEISVSVAVLDSDNENAVTDSLELRLIPTEGWDARLTLNGPGGTWTASGGEDNTPVTGTGYNRDSLVAAWELLGRDVTDEDDARMIDAMDTVLLRMLNDPWIEFSLTSQSQFDPFNTDAPKEGLQSNGAGGSSGPAPPFSTGITRGIIAGLVIAGVMLVLWGIGLRVAIVLRNPKRFQAA